LLCDHRKIIAKSRRNRFVIAAQLQCTRCKITA
jgi:hypothetical protein